MILKPKKLLPVLLAALVLIIASWSGFHDSPAGITGGSDGPTSVFLTGQSDLPEDSPAEEAGQVGAGTETPEAAAALDEDACYTSKDDVALYIHMYGHLPSNFVTKAEAKKAGWEGGPVDDYLPGKCIGGDRFGNREGLLPDADGRVWTECDINTLGASSRGAERIVFSNDGLIYYTADHYDSFELLYG